MLSLHFACAGTRQPLFLSLPCHVATCFPSAKYRNCLHFSAEQALLHLCLCESGAKNFPPLQYVAAHCSIAFIGNASLLIQHMTRMLNQSCIFNAP